MVGGKSNKGMAAKVWEERQFQNLDDSLQLGTRNIKIALRKLRKMTRTSDRWEFNLDGTIKSTAKNAGYLEIEYLREKLNDINLIVFFDVGGSMDPFIRYARNFFLQQSLNLKILNIIIFIIVFMNRFGKTISEEMKIEFQLRVFSINLAKIIKF